MLSFLRRKGVADTETDPAPGIAPEAPGLPVYSPVAGTLLVLDAVPDPVFSRGLVGPGFAVDPADGTFGAPVEGTVVMVPDSRHAIGIRTDEGVEVLVHVGVDSVTLKGEGLEVLVAEGDRVHAGEPVLRADLDLLRARIPSVITPVIVTGTEGRSVGEPDLAAAPGSAVLTLAPA